MDECLRARYLGRRYVHKQIQLVVHISRGARKQGGDVKHRRHETNRIESLPAPDGPFMKLMAEEYDHNST